MARIGPPAAAPFAAGSSHTVAENSKLGTSAFLFLATLVLLLAFLLSASYVLSAAVLAHRAVRTVPSASPTVPPSGASQSSTAPERSALDGQSTDT